MEKRLLTFFLFACLTCSAQLPVVPMVLRSAASVPGPQTISGLGYYWVSSDIPVGSTVGANGSGSTNWVDRIQGAIWTNGNSGTRPTNSATGVMFDGSKTLTNTFIRMTVNSNLNYVWIVGKFVRNNPASGADNWLSEDGSADGTGVPVFGIGALNIIDAGSQSPWYKCITNVFVDTLIPGTPNVTSTLITTNNVSTAKTFNLVASGTHLVSSFAATVNGNTRGFFYVTEVAFFTNDITSAQAIILHTYATNTYNYAP